MAAKDADAGAADRERARRPPGLHRGPLGQGAGRQAIHAGARRRCSATRRRRAAPRSPARSARRHPPSASAWSSRRCPGGARCCVAVAVACWRRGRGGGRRGLAGPLAGRRRRPLQPGRRGGAVRARRWRRCGAAPGAGAQRAAERPRRRARTARPPARRSTRRWRAASTQRAGTTRSASRSPTPTRGPPSSATRPRRRSPPHRRAMPTPRPPGCWSVSSGLRRASRGHPPTPPRRSLPSRPATSRRPRPRGARAPTSWTRTRALLRAELDDVKTTGDAGLSVGRAQAAALARGYFAMLEPSFREQRGAPAADEMTAAFDELVAASVAKADERIATATATIDERLLGFRAAPLAESELVRRAGQFQRFLALVPVEYGRGISDGRVTKAFEIQEAITFRDSAASAFADLESVLITRDEQSTRAISATLDQLGSQIQSAARGGDVADPDDLKGTADDTLDAAKKLFPARVARRRRHGRLRRHQGVARSPRGRGQGRVVRDGRAGAPRGLRVLRVRPRAAPPRPRPRPLPEGRGLLLVRRGRPPGARAAGRPPRDAGGDRRDARRARRRALRGRGGHRCRPGQQHDGHHQHGHRDFREGLEAVLILAVLTASMVGAQRHLRRPLYVGAGAALAITALTWVVAQTILTSLNRYGEKLSGRRRADSDRRPAADPQLVLPQGLLDRPPVRPAPEEEARHLAAHRLPGDPGRRPHRPRLHERLPRGLRDRAVPAGDRPRGQRRRHARRRRRRARGDRAASAS